MKPHYALAVLMALIFSSLWAGYSSYNTTSRRVNEDMGQALALALREQQSCVISQDTVRSFNNHLHIAELRGKATLTVEAGAKEFRAKAHCDEATVFALSDQRPAAVLWFLTGC